MSLHILAVIFVVFICLMAGLTRLFERRMLRSTLRRGPLCDHCVCYSKGLYCCNCVTRSQVSIQA
jgi:hypothetical protein